ncbi:MAG: flagellar biosynthesis protein FlhF [Pirellulales bacterium]|nr:flagellar biosynthesis protein FlhF [Pirellulales bacterium]
MTIHTFRAKTMPQALDLVRRELGPEAMVLHTRELNTGLVSRMLRGRAYEIAATPTAAAPRNAHRDLAHPPENPHSSFSIQHSPVIPHSPFAIPHPSPSPQPPAPNVQEFASLVQQLRTRPPEKPNHEIPPALFDLYTDLIEADLDEEVARDLLDQLRRDSSLQVRDARAARSRLAHIVQSELEVSGPIRAITGAGRVVALIGPTGVGKTTTIAKLAANYRLKENRRVGLITVDTYRIAAVEQLRTYAEIIDLPMEVVSTPREMREAVQKMRDFDLVLMDTAGRSPRDEVRIRELRAMLTEAEPDEVHLVLSAAASARSLTAAAEKFGAVGVTALVITKLDEATGLGNLLTLSRTARLPFSYLTDGQNVPDDIAVADPRPLANMILNLDAAA